MSSIAFVGIGGQGIVFAAEVLAEILFNHGYYVAQLQSYGAEVRGGSVLTYVVFDREPIDNPFIDSFDIVMVLHEGGLRRWCRYVEKSKLAIVDEDLVSYRRENALVYPIVKKSIEQKVHGAENIVAVGIALKLFPIDIELDRALEVLKGKRNVEKNVRALKIGFEIGKEIAEKIKR
ncbi:MAG TPA: hypothetical protein ENF93_00040 [Ignisphaera sp.]|nr:hypothetical protein [Ignisphaera sp.]